jgi:hypothetical protein
MINISYNIPVKDCLALLSIPLKLILVTVLALLLIVDVTFDNTAYIYSPYDIQAGLGE